MVAESAMRAGAACLGVATVGEARKLRDEGITAPILVLGPTHPGEHEVAVKLGLELAVGDLSAIESIQRAANQQRVKVKVHLKIDTGMHRFGCDPGDAIGLATVISESPGLQLAAIFTHYAESDAIDDANALRQAELFDRTVAIIKDAGIDVPLLPGMKPALQLESTVSRLFDLRAGERISYGGTYEALRDERDALIPCGYADGYRRALSNRGWASSGASVLPVHGRVCMDQMIVGVPDDADIALGDRVVLISDGEGESPTAVELAEMLDTIPYEIITGISARVPRVYVRDGDVVAIEDLSGLTRL
jgi:alanine racemase